MKAAEEKWERERPARKLAARDQKAKRDRRAREQI